MLRKISSYINVSKRLCHNMKSSPLMADSSALSLVSKPIVQPHIQTAIDDGKSLQEIIRLVKKTYTPMEVQAAFSYVSDDKNRPIF